MSSAEKSWLEVFESWKMVENNSGLGICRFQLRTRRRLTRILDNEEKHCMNEAFKAVTLAWRRDVAWQRHTVGLTILPHVHTLDVYIVYTYTYTYTYTYICIYSWEPTVYVSYLEGTIKAKDYRVITLHTLEDVYVYITKLPSFSFTLELSPLSLLLSSSLPHRAFMLSNVPCTASHLIWSVPKATLTFLHVILLMKSNHHTQLLTSKWRRSRTLPWRKQPLKGLYEFVHGLMSRIVNFGK